MGIEPALSAWESAADVGGLSWENEGTGQDRPSARKSPRVTVIPRLICTDLARDH